MNPHHWIMTASGKKFDYDAPKIDSICIEDIAVALSNICRFNGHSGSFYSVAEHSVLVSYLVDQGMIGAALCGLMHDAAEAYCCDVPLPLKESMRVMTSPYPSSYHVIIGRVEAIIHRKYQVKHTKEIASEVKHCDVLACLLEAKTFMGSHRMRDWPNYSVESVVEAHDRLGLISFENRPDFFLRDQGRSSLVARNLFLERFHELYHP